MSVLTLRPNADSTPLECIAQPNNAHYTVVDEETLDEADYLTVVPMSQQNCTDIFGLPNHSSESGTINSVKVKLKAKYSLTGTSSVEASVNPSVKIGSTVYNSGAQNLTTSTAEYTYTWTTNPATTAAWSWTEIDDLLAGLVLVNGFTSKNNNRNPYVYQLWVEVDYTAGGGSTAKPHYYYLQQ